MRGRLTLAIGHVRHAGVLHHASGRTDSRHHVGSAWKGSALSRAHGILLWIVHHLLRLLLLRVVLLGRLIGTRSLARLHMRVL